MYVVIIGLPIYDVINFIINAPIKPFSYMIKKSLKNKKDRKNEKRFLDEIKNICHPFKGLSLK